MNNDVYDKLSKMQIQDSGVDDYYKTLGNESLTLKDFVSRFSKRLKSKLHVFIIWAVWIVVILHMVWHLMGICMSILYLDSGFMDGNLVNAVLWVLLPVITWLISTRFKYWNYANRKLFLLSIAVLNLCLYVTQLFITFVFVVLVPLVFLMPVNMDITADMVIALARIVAVIIGTIPPVFVSAKLVGMVYNADNKGVIVKYKLFRGVDFRKGKRFKYDFKIVRHKDTGVMHVVKEKDRSLHFMADGVTGTAKTAGAFTPGIANDLDTKLQNEDYLKRKYLKLVKSGDLKLNTLFDDFEFATAYFSPVTKKGVKAVKKYAHIRSAGMTAMAPNSSFADTIFELATKRGIKVNRIDPVLTADGRHKEGFIGFNPLYINPEHTGLERKIKIFEKATLFADVCQAVYELSGKGDPYFTSLNRNISTSIVVLLELTYEKIHGKQPTPENVQEIINDFQRSNRYLEVLKERPDRNDYQYIIDLVENELLGEGAKKLVEQARGLRVLISEVLTHPLIKSVLCAEKSVDMDKALANGEITVVNYALELGQSQATAFGLFFALNFNNAVLRRPGTDKTRLPHFYYIDEFPVLLHPRMEQCFTLFRQYMCFMHIAIQSLDQMERTDTTRYMKNILLGNTAHQIFFGRLSPTEMELIEKMGGKHMTVMEQKQVSEQALSVENTSLTYGTRFSKSQENWMEGADARYKDFMEVTMITVDEGNAVLPFAGTVDFIERYRTEKVKRFRVDWSEYYEEGAAEPVKEKRVITEVTDIEEIQGTIGLKIHEELESPSGSFDISSDGFDLTDDETPNVPEINIMNEKSDEREDELEWQEMEE